MTVITTRPRPQRHGTRLDELWDVLPEESSITSTGELAIGGVAVSELAKEFGTPLHIMDEAGLRRQMKRLVEGLNERWPRSEVLFASKSLPIIEMYRIAQQEGLSIDVAGEGELRFAIAAGVDPKLIYFHGNAKTDDELRLALELGIGGIIIDNFDELKRLENLATRPQNVLVRVIPGIDAITHVSQATGGLESKFGLPLDQATMAIHRITAHSFLRLTGIHMHIGSQILETDQFVDAIEKLGAAGKFDTYNAGGGLGIKYTYDDDLPSVESYLDAVVGAAKRHLPPDAKLMIEPGRSVVGRAGVTLYRVVTVKRTGRTFVAVDGGMADQLDIALTGQRYEAVLANRINEPWKEDVQLVGRQCESGDLLVDGAPMPLAQSGDLVVLAATGAYAYTMANNYNGALKPAIVFVADGKARLVTRRENFDDVLALHSPVMNVAPETPAVAR